MKLKLDEDVNANLNIVIPKDDLADLIELATNSVLTIIAASTAAYILKQVFTKEPV